MEKETFLLIGLGNPGLNYRGTRHNCGFEVIDRLSQKLNAPLVKNHCQAKVAEIHTGQQRLVLCQPQTFMNLSGESVSELIHWYKCPLDHILVIYDDVDLPTGQLRLRKSGSSGTHNGMRSVLAHIPSGAFPRLRIGIGKQPEGWDIIDWVLGKPLSREELECLQLAFDRACECALDFVHSGIEHAMQSANRNP